MECNCKIECYPGDFDYEVCDGVMTKSKNQQLCTECGRNIAPGENYEETDDKKNELFIITCADCLVARKVFFGANYYVGGLWDAIHEAFRYDIPESCLSQLTPYHRDKLCEEIETWWWPQLEDENDGQT